MEIIDHHSLLDSPSSAKGLPSRGMRFLGLTLQSARTVPDQQPPPIETSDGVCSQQGLYVSYTLSRCANNQQTTNDKRQTTNKFEGAMWHFGY